MSKLAEAAEALNAAHPAGLAQGGRLPPLFFFTDEARTPDPAGALARLPEGCGVVFRHYGAADRATLARETVRVAHDQGRLCLVAGDAALARAAGADGVHWPERTLRTLSERLGTGLVTAAVHGAEGLHQAEALRLNAVFLAPVFPTESHPGAATLGPSRFTELARAARVPVYALGGVSAGTAPELAASGAVGLAAIGALL